MKKRMRDGNVFKIFVISFGHLCHDIYTSFLSPLLPLLINKLALSYASAGFISVVLRLPSLFNPFIGAYVDRFNLKYIVIVSPTITAIAMCLMGSAPTYQIIILLALIAGVSSSCFHVPTPVFLKELAGKRVGAAMSSFQIGGELSRTIGPIVVLGAVSLWTINGIYRLIPLGLFMSFFLFWAFRNLPQRTISHQLNVTSSILTTFNNARVLFISIFGILLCKSLTASVLAAFLPTYLTTSGESLWFSGGALSILQAAAVAGVFISGTLSDKFGCKKVLIFLTAFTPIFMLLFIHSSGWIFIISLLLLGITSFSSTPVILALIQKSGFAFPSIANGLYMTINFMLSSSMILVVGKLSDIIGIEPTFNVCALCSFIGLPFVFLLKSKNNEI